MRSKSDAGPALTRTQRARRDDIVGAAIAIINRDGYAAASIDKIAREAETSKSTVLYHFKTKEAINEALVGALFEDGASAMAPHITGAETYVEKLRAYLTSNLRYIAGHAAHVSAVHRILENTDLRPPGDDPVAWLARFLADGQEAGEFGAFDPHVLALSIRAVIDNASFYFTAHPDLDFDHYIGEITRLFDRAVRS
ncbi:TetR/AcrR family transcriptional regulator [Actinomadura sp. B10D3]|uniref:TetR/AcrR family transcriptional regulator n=1 Tax=Actinomadura sp. B10D3 TaxID=3153557 RepID=UPI00325ECCD5